MRFSTLLSALVGFTATASAKPVSIDITKNLIRDNNGYTQVAPVDITEVVITKDNTLNGTHTGDELITRPPTEQDQQSIQAVNAVAATLPLQFTNNFGSAVNAYVVGYDSNEAVVFVRQDGSLVYPSSGGSAVPVPITTNVKIPVAAGQVATMRIPIAMHSTRIYFSVGDLNFGVVKTDIGEGLVQPDEKNPTDPSASLNWGFVELTLNTDGSLFANISYVDFMGLPLGMKLDVNGGSAQTAYGLKANSINSACSDLSAQQAQDGAPWAALCQSNSAGLIRVVSPNSYSVTHPNGFGRYWDNYINQVWSKYSNENLVIDTQSGFGNLNCRVSGNQMTCNGGDNRAYPKPTAIDIWGCNSGPFGRQAGDNEQHIRVIPRLCSAFVRSTLLLAGGNVQPSLPQSTYYTVNPSNHYGRLVHKYEIDGKGYAFPYDDVNPNGSENAEGSVSHGSPNLLTVYIGGQ
ncbi:unnamed protein product [Clonostachys solani]|uniref:GH64 domain-containing protein n=1 Tax=Clonostachys solani TaxID=160281 RepID=A0A9N9Z0D2_9HYPO|nr:unnamed protein product [Clonostachys solani]